MFAVGLLDARTRGRGRGHVTRQSTLVPVVDDGAGDRGGLRRICAGEGCRSSRAKGLVLALLCFVVVGRIVFATNCIDLIVDVRALPVRKLWYYYCYCTVFRVGDTACSWRCVLLSLLHGYCQLLSNNASFGHVLLVLAAKKTDLHEINVATYSQVSNIATNSR